MLSEETFDEYRRMTPGERLELTLKMMRESTPYLSEGPADVVRRRFELLERENDIRNRAMIEVFAKITITQVLFVLLNIIL